MGSIDFGSRRLLGMGRLFPVWSGTAGSGESPMERDDDYLTEPVSMPDSESGRQQVVLRVTPNLEA